MTTGTITYTFETDADAALRETWQAAVDSTLTGDELADALRDELHAGNAEFISEEASDEHNRNLDENTIRAVTPGTDPIPSLTVQIAPADAPIMLRALAGYHADVRADPDLADDERDERLQAIEPAIEQLRRARSAA